MGTLLCRTDAERERIIDMSRRLRRVSVRAIALLFAASLLGIPAYGWAPPAAVIVAAAAFWFLQGRLHRFRRPEYALALSWVISQTMVASVVLVATGPHEYLLALFAFPMMLASVVWPTRAVVAGAVLSCAALVAVALIEESALIAEAPPILVHQLALVLATALVASIARDAEIASRRRAIVDELTGTLNRTAFDARISELEQASAAGDATGVAIVVGDIDAFKAINDEHGHATGDAVLRDVAYRMRKVLPAFAGLYRYGGEEFVVVLPEADAAEATATAERLRAAVAATPVSGLTVTMSFGVAVCEPGRRLVFDELFARADAALYEAKDEGRDRVRVAHGSFVVTPLRRARRVEHRRAVTAVPSPPDGEERSQPTADREPSRLVDATQRQHLLELTGRLRHMNHVPYGIASVAVLFLGPWFGWWGLAPVLAGAAVYRAVERRLPRLRRPEYWLAGAWLLAQTGNAGAFLVMDVQESLGVVWALPMLMIMLIGSSAVFPRRVAFCGVVYTGLLMLGVLALVDPRALERPSELVFLFALLGSIGLVGTAVGESAVHHRGAAVVDRLTGLLNRRALEARTVELAHHSALTAAPVAVVVGDVDHFKRVNDTLGHAAGDAVLREVAQRLRRNLRAFEDLYRCGGEEFVVLLAGATLGQAEAVAERLREAVASSPAHDAAVTMSFGAAATAPGVPFDFDELRGQADAALYAAKASGRDRVVAAGAPVEESETLAA